MRGLALESSGLDRTRELSDEIVAVGSAVSLAREVEVNAESDVYSNSLQYKYTQTKYKYAYTYAYP